MNHAASVEGRERLRLFCALRLPDEVVDALVEWGGRHLAARVVPRANLHITLAFLGHRPAEDLDAILAATGAAATAAQPIRLEPLGYRETRSVGMLVLADEEDAATNLADSAVYYLTPSEVYARTVQRGQTVRLGGLVKTEKVVGKVGLVYWPPADWGQLSPSGDRRGG